jgi:hypothetical protein
VFLSYLCRHAYYEYNCILCLTYLIKIVNYVGMHVARAFWRSANGKTYQSVYLRESYRVGDKVQKRNIANLTHRDPKEIASDK